MIPTGRNYEEVSSAGRTLPPVKTHKISSISNGPVLQLLNFEDRRLAVSRPPDLRRWRMLDPTRIGKSGLIPAITWKAPEGFDQLGVIARHDGVVFVRRNDYGQLGKLFVGFTFTATRFAGRRPWFSCPSCGQACRILYGTQSLRCRKCRNLKYQSQYEAPAFRLLDRASKIRRRLGPAGASGEPLPPKPRRMCWRTYRRLERLVQRLEAAG